MSNAVTTGLSEMRHADSDSVNLGSNPSPPATANADVSGVSRNPARSEISEFLEQTAHADRTKVGTAPLPFGTGKHLCDDCGWRGLDAEVLSGPNPFDPSETVLGCPNCKSPNTMLPACDEPGCWRSTSCGTPTPTGYRRTCSEHYPNKRR